MTTNNRRLVVASAVVGVGLSGFFDGIVLHQILQWHHLLSLVPGESMRQIENQILADGLFHLLMYLVTAIGLYLLWRSRPAATGNRANWRSVAGGGLIGFGLWNLADVGLFHWTLGIHRVRVDVPDPLIYDVTWLAMFGVVPLLSGWLVLRSGSKSGDASGRSAAALLGMLALVAAPLASLPVPNSRTAVVFFGPAASPTAAYTAALAANAPVLWINGKATMMAVQLNEPGATARLYRAGAVFVTRSPALAGCAVALRS